MDDHELHRRADELLAVAMDLPAGQRVGYLDRECGEDEGLRALVGRLVDHASGETLGFLPTGGALEKLVGTETRLDRELAGGTIGRYQIAREIGRGGMGVVYEARDELLHRSVAVKILLLPDLDPEGRARFLREARAAAALQHPSIVAIFDVGEADGNLFLVMEYVPGPSLAESPPGSLPDAIAIALQVCDALEHAHDRGVVHRDLKPGNIVVARDHGGRPIAKLTDLGIALTRGTARVTRTGSITGTPSYMAPEQALGQAVDGRADLYALGVLLYEWATGRPPFDGDDALEIVSQHIHAPVVPPRTFRSDLPAGLEPTILRLLEKDPERRYPSAAALRDALAAIVADVPAASPADPDSMGSLRRGRMVGRARELDRLQGLWRSASGGACGLVLISGEPGIGKTRLALELIATARLEGARVLEGGCYENEATSPYLPFVEAIRRLVRERDDDELRDLLGDTVAEIARLAPEVESRLGPVPPRPPLSPQEERLRLFDHVTRLLSRLAEGKGLVVFLDDLQWADHGSINLLHYLLRHLEDRPVLVLGTYREVELDRGHPLSRALVDWDRERLSTRVRLERLDSEATARMVATLLGQADVPGDLVASVHAETEGNPFFVEEVVKALVAAGGLVREASGWRARRTDRFVLPQSVKAAIGSRLSRISDRSNEVLRTAAVLGKQFDFAELEWVAGSPEDELLDALDEASHAQLIATGRGESFAFTHDKIREVLYEELNPVRRRRLHARVAEGLERMRASGGTQVAVEELAYHYVAAGDDANGRRWALEAAAAARQVFAWDEALEMLTRARQCTEALGLDDQLPGVDQALGDVAWAKGEVKAAAEHYERALAGADDPDLINQLRAKAGEVYVTTGDPRGLEHVRAALSEVDPARTPRTAAHAMIVEARYHHIHGELERAAGLYPAAIALIESLDDPGFLARAVSFVAGTYQHLADFERSDAAAQRCLHIGEAEGIPEAVLLGCEFLAENCILRGWWDACVGYMEREEALALEVHAGERYGWSHYRALALYALGMLDEAERVAARGIEEAVRLGELRLELFLTLALATCLADRGRLERALELARDALRRAEAAGLVSHRITARASLAQLLMRGKRFDEAGREAAAAFELWLESGSRGVGLMLGADIAEGLLRGGAPERARQALDRHLEIALATGAEPRRAQNRRVRALIAADAGLLEEALSELDGAVETLDACGSRMEHLRALRDRAGIRRRAGRTAAADADSSLARRLASERGATPSPVER